MLTYVGGDDNNHGSGNDPHIRVHMAGINDRDLTHQCYTNTEDTSHR